MLITFLTIIIIIAICYMLITLCLCLKFRTPTKVERHRENPLEPQGFETLRGLASSTSEAHQPRLVFGPPTGGVPGIVRCFSNHMKQAPYMSWLSTSPPNLGRNRDVVGYSSPRVRTSKNKLCFAGQNVYVHDHGFHLATHSWATCALNVTTPS